MAGIWVDEGLQEMHRCMLGDGTQITTLTISPILTPSSITNSTTFADLSFSSSPQASPKTAFGGWGYVTDTSAHNDIATQVWQWNFLEADYGTAFTGYAIYDAVNEILQFAETFSTGTFVVGSSNTFLQINVQDTRKDCAT